MTQKLYYEDLYMKSFDAEVVSQEERDGKVAAMLDRTAFYPGGGGQPCDLGTLGGMEVEDVFEEDGNIYHVIPEKLPEGTVRGEIDWDRRFELMQQHLGQHLLSAVFVRDFGLNTAGLRMDRDTLYIDLDGFADEQQVAAAERAANDAIYENIPVEVLYPSPEEIAKNSKRPIPETDEEIRIIKIGDLDYIPCCGLQNRYTGEVGVIKILDSVKQKKGSRIHFLCGRPALRKIIAICGDYSAIEAELDCPDGEAAERVAKQHREVKSLKKKNKSLLKRLAAEDAAEIAKGAEEVNGISVIAKVLEDVTQDEMKILYSELTKQEGTAVLLGGETPDGAFLMFGCNKKEKRVDVREAFNAALPMIEGKGGGGPSYAQGFGPGAAALADAVKKAGEILKAGLE